MDASPDEAAMAPLGSMMKKYSSGHYYRDGRMNSIVYPVTGGMEYVMKHITTPLPFFKMVQENLDWRCVCVFFFKKNHLIYD